MALTLAKGNKLWSAESKTFLVLIFAQFSSGPMKVGRILLQSSLIILMLLERELCNQG